LAPAQRVSPPPPRRFFCFYLRLVNYSDDLAGHLKLADFGNAARLSTSGSVTKVTSLGI
jgi:hypothetical protein